VSTDVENLARLGLNSSTRRSDAVDARCFDALQIQRDARRPPSLRAAARLTVPAEEVAGGRLGRASRRHQTSAGASAPPASARDAGGRAPGFQRAIWCVGRRGLWALLRVGRARATPIADSCNCEVEDGRHGRRVREARSGGYRRHLYRGLALHASARFRRHASLPTALGCTPSIVSANSVVRATVTLEDASAVSIPLSCASVSGETLRPRSKLWSIVGGGIAMICAPGKAAIIRR